MWIFVIIIPFYFSDRLDFVPVLPTKGHWPKLSYTVFRHPDDYVQTQAFPGFWYACLSQFCWINYQWSLTIRHLQEYSFLDSFPWIIYKDQRPVFSFSRHHIRNNPTYRSPNPTVSVLKDQNRCLSHQRRKQVLTRSWSYQIAIY